jgi:putative membrane protein
MATQTSTQQQQHNNAIMKDLSHPRSAWEHLRIFLTGLAMGAADIVPGVSGGTMAFILGIYETLINAIKSFNLQAIRLALKFDFKALFQHIPFVFLLLLGGGIGLTLITLSGVLSSLLADPEGRILLFAFFFGLVVASIIAVGQKVQWAAGAFGMLILGAVVAFAIVNIVPAEGSHDAPVLFFSGMIAICAMILPGVSGSFILLVLGQYDYILNSVSGLVSDRDLGNLQPLIFVGLGAIVGIVIFSRVLSWTLQRYYNTTIALLVGFMVGSLWKIWPFKACGIEDIDRHGDVRCLQELNLLPDTLSSFLIAFGLAFAGFVLVSLLDHLQTRDNAFIRLFVRRQPANMAPAEG